jgi:3-hydroxybutyryl-CoA dehydrogenase
MTRIALVADEKFEAGFKQWLGSLERIELSSADPDILLDLRILETSDDGPIGAPIVITNLLTFSVSGRLSQYSKNTKLIGASILPHYVPRQKLIECALPAGSQMALSEVTQIMATLGKECEVIGDAVGGVFPRTIAMIINEAAFAVQEKVASVADIDSAMKLGTNYPVGPLAFCDEVGAETVIAILEALSKEYGADRYRPASLLRRYAEANQKFYSA